MAGWTESWCARVQDGGTANQDGGGAEDEGQWQMESNLLTVREGEMVTYGSTTDNTHTHLDKPTRLV